MLDTIKSNSDRNRTNSLNLNGIPLIDFYEDYDKIFTPQIDQITDHLFLGNYLCARYKDMLKMRNITHILVCGNEMQELYPDEFKYMTIPIEDEEETNIKQYFEKCFEFIDSSKKILVHCKAGVSRSATIIIAYLMWKNKISFKDAYKFVKTKRNVINPNKGFIKQLKDFESEIFINSKFFNN